MACVNLATAELPGKRRKVILANILTALTFARGTVMDYIAQVNAQDR